MGCYGARTRFMKSDSPIPNLEQRKARPPVTGKAAKVQMPHSSSRMHGKSTAVSNPQRDAAEAQKKYAIRLSLKEHAFQLVWVGNLPQNATEKIVREAFAPCGAITSVQVRCARGNVQVVNSTSGSSRDRPYASVYFKRKYSVRKALDRNGMCLQGLKVTVSLSPADLPVAQHIIREYLHQRRDRGKAAPGPRDLISSTPIQETQIEISSTTDKRALKRERPLGNHHAWNISFRECIM